MAASSAALFHLELMFTCVIGAGMAHTHAVQGLFHIFLTDTSRGFHGRYIGVCMSELRQDTSFASLLNSLTMLRDTVCPTEPERVTLKVCNEQHGLVEQTSLYFVRITFNQKSDRKFRGRQKARGDMNQHRRQQG
ncbi:predicted protein [Plenodomus lingam JN3]|uniref:Predicted protein n=1 Tax=Leptosphaeria maculans (strain JN3 / isolate v23.1.3 / race Av1-4-5-6-7-8) TaxID=985895 RepID=E5A9E3_LEPMJ|nr:predicted protein [Plenodomus lingam JN3]CBY00284.1 predicted protein [Plenodomus lingam JN3]